jgi:hypothetical protein
MNQTTAVATSTATSRWSLPSKQVTNLEPKENRICFETRAAYNPFVGAIVILVPVLLIAAGAIQYIVRNGDENDEERMNSQIILAVYVPLGATLGFVYLTVLPYSFRLYQDGHLEVVNWLGCTCFSMTIKTAEGLPNCVVVTGPACKLDATCSGSVMLTAKYPKCGCISKLLISPREPAEFMRTVQSVIDIEEQLG